MIRPTAPAVLSLAFLMGNSIAATAETRAPGQPNQFPVSFSWTSEYWPKGLRQWSQTAPDQWREEYEDGTPEKKFRLLGRISMGGTCAGLHLKSLAEPLEAFIPGSRCSSKWLLFRWVSIYTRSPQWVGQAEIRNVEYAPATPAKPAPR